MSPADWVALFGTLMVVSALYTRGKLICAVGVGAWLGACIVVSGVLLHLGILNGGVLATVAQPVVPAHVVAELRHVDVAAELPRRPTQSIPTKTARAADNAVLIYASGCSDAYWGSGWALNSRRVVTAAHVVAGASRVRLTYRGKDIEGRVEKLIPEHDVAIIAVESDIRPMKTGGKLGDAWVAGYPDGGDLTTVATRPITQYLTVPDTYGTRSRVQLLAGRGGVVGGMSGAPLLDTRGRVVGTLLASLNRSGLIAAPLTTLGEPGIKGAGRCL